MFDSSRRRPRGFVSVDAMVGLILITALGSVLSISVYRQSRAEKRLADARATDRRVESALLSLQGGIVPPPDEIRLRRLPTTAPAGRTWVEIAAPGRGPKLYGVVATATADRFLAAQRDAEGKGGQ